MKSQSPRQHAQGLHGPAPDEILELKGQVIVSFNYQHDTTKNHLRGISSVRWSGSDWPVVGMWGWGLY